LGSLNNVNSRIHSSAGDGARKVPLSRAWKESLDAAGVAPGRKLA